MSKAKKNILFAALAALALTVCLVGVTGAYFIAQASRTNTLTVGITLPPKVRPKAGKTAKASQTAKNGRKRKAEPISA